MQKELLLAISDDRAASYNLRFLREVFSKFCELKLTLFYVTPRRASFEVNASKIKPRKKGFDEKTAYSRTKGEESLEDAARWIRDVVGCSGDNVTVKVAHSRKGTVEELIHEAHEGMYDAMLLGRRTFTWFEELFEDSVSHKLLWNDMDFPIWICRRPPDDPRHDVLLCVDGSPPAFRMVDHAGYMLAEEEKHTFTLFYVAGNEQSFERSGHVFEQAKTLLEDNGVSVDRIQFKIANGVNIPKTIMLEAEEGRYSAVGVGKHGAETDVKMRGMFPSSVTVNLMRKLEGAALWISK